MIRSTGEYQTLIESDLAKDRDRAIHDSAQLDVWLEIVTNYPGYRSFVAQNKTIPREVLRVLIADDDRAVRLTVAMRRVVGKDEEFAGLLASDIDPGVRSALAKNPKLGESLLLHLTQDDDDWVRACASKALAERESSRPRSDGAVPRWKGGDTVQQDSPRIPTEMTD